ncbi:type II secretory pathway predicted ATPase ExeA [Chromobacterium alkanivorans]|uniref:ExeA family protein n=1 Tax=Chromobacterium alkanivorans TaxID=1071719 RepID=UPI002168A9F0|nr:AAA family ATPase [Chromobacterium alkanivorans]MCS3806728.1 type II secretory pathway predicted ATPase ExeA [Chromobacterium alkanivorans]MCS3821100.1 type II secretory pathway predicted ATPase ExeA [Chromobacterium alkanivorans]MCS3875988.1 type II secretory pathway predicted ATPase ExeA [Chromobacterium alkanivorans]
MLKLKSVLQAVGRKQSDLAEHLGLSQASVAQIVNHGEWPKSLDETDLQESIIRYLQAHGAADGDIDSAFEEVSEPRANAARSVSPSKTATESNQEESMLLRKQALFPATRKHFNLFRDPFGDDAIQSHEDMYVSPDIRYVREAMLQTAKHGGLLAVVAESGAGKTTLMRDLEDRILRETQPILLIKPYVLGMEDNDQKGKTLKATHIAEALMAAVAPLEKPKSSPEARFAQLHKALKESHAAGFRHCLVIDEAHALPIPTIKHLKRFFELELGFKKLLSIILIGQPELKTKLSERDAAVREVVQRCEMVELAPLEGGRLDEYLKFKFERMSKPVSEVIDASGIDALRAKLTVATRRDRPETMSLLYPLAVGNLLTACMNLAADLGVPLVNADVVKGV